MPKGPYILENELIVRSSIIDALRHLLTLQNIDAISVKELCEVADISRTTFYRYFPDKYAITEWHFGYYCDRYSQGIGRRYTFYESTRQIIGVFQKEADLYIGSCQSKKSSSMLLYAKRHFVENLSNTITEYLGLSLSESLVFQIEYTSHLVIDMTGWWINNPNAIPLDNFLDILTSLIPADLRQLLDGHVKKECL